MIVIDICLTDVPKELITEGKFGETHTLQLSQTKEQREAKTPPVYVGSGKAYKFEQKPKTTADEPAKYEDNSLPF